ncbi:hypothetical protein [Vibrio chagasii]|uniref:hypothetical protein n=1 Tax=Vibrio chagasii TaxID=170679 RepID=UPI003D9FFB7F
MKPFRYLLILFSVLLFSGCTTTKPNRTQWFDHLPDNYLDKTLDQLTPELNAKGRERLAQCRERKEQVAGYCFMYAYQTTDTDNNDQIFPYSYSFWDYMEAIDAGKYIPTIQGYERDYINRKRLDDLMSQAPKPSSKKSSRSEKSKAKTLLPRTSVEEYGVDEGMHSHPNEVIETKRIQVTFELPGEK